MRRLILLFLLSCVNVCVVGQVAEYYIYNYSTQGNDSFFDLCEQSDSNITIVGKSFLASDDALLLSVNQAGDSHFVYHLDGGGTDIFNSICEGQNHVTIAGRTNSFGFGVDDGLIMRINNDGQIYWQTVIGGVSDDGFYKVYETKDGGAIACGFTESFNSGNYDFYLAKLDSQGVLEWSNGYGGAGEEQAVSMKQTMDEGYILIGSTRSFSSLSSTDPNVYVVKVDSLGVEQWSKEYHSPTGFQGQTNDKGNTILELENGNFLTGGAGYFVSDSWHEDYWITELDTAGEIVWSKTYGYHFVTTGGYGENVIQIIKQDDGYIVVGEGEQPIGGDKGKMLSIFKIDFLGNLVWSNYYESGNTTNVGGVTETFNKSLFSASYQYQDGVGVISKHDSSGEITACDNINVLNLTETNVTADVITNNPPTVTTNGGLQDTCVLIVDTVYIMVDTICKGWTFVDEPDKGMGESFLIFPNPNLGSFTINMNGFDFESLTVLNTLGKQEEFLVIRDHFTSTEIQLKTKTPGVYFVQLKDQFGETFSGRVIVK